MQATSATARIGGKALEDESIAVAGTYARRRRCASHVKGRVTQPLWSVYAEPGASRWSHPEGAGPRRWTRAKGKIKEKGTGCTDSLSTDDLRSIPRRSLVTPGISRARYTLYFCVSPSLLTPTADQSRSLAGMWIWDETESPSCSKVSFTQIRRDLIDAAPALISLFPRRTDVFS